MNCIVSFYEDEVLQCKYSVKKYNELILIRNDKVKNLCNLFFDNVYRFNYYQTTNKSDNDNYDICTDKEPLMKPYTTEIMHRITLALYCGNCKKMNSDYYDARQLNHFTHYLRCNNGENFNDLKEIFENLLSTYEVNGLNRGSLIVFDLDNTLIDNSLEPLSKNLRFQMNVVKKIFDYVVLWSHGTSTHVSKALCSIKIPYHFFHIIITRPDGQSCGGNKGLGFVLKRLYNEYKVREISFSCLVDDTATNFTNDYMVFIHIPNNYSDEDLTQFYEFIVEKLREIKCQTEGSRGNTAFTKLDTSTFRCWQQLLQINTK